MNWGKGIFISIILFLTGTAVMIVIAVNSDYDLVANNYYEQGIKYQDKIEKINRTNALPEKTLIEFFGNSISISFPKMFSQEIIKGEVKFYRPSDAGRDFKIPLQVDSGNKTMLSTAKLEKGFWKVQVEWSAGAVQYFNESSIIVK